MGQFVVEWAFLVFLQIVESGAHIAGVYALDCGLSPLWYACVRQFVGAAVCYTAAAANAACSSSPSGGDNNNGATMSSLLAFALPRQRGECSQIFGLGVLFALNAILFIYALDATTALNCAVYIPLVPIVTFFIAAATKRERVSSSALAGTFVAVSGSVLVTVGSATSQGGDFSTEDVLTGNALMFAWCVAVSVQIIWQNRLLITYQPLPLTAWCLAIGTAVNAVVCVCVDRSAADYQATDKFCATLAVLYVGIVGTGVGRFIEAWANARVSSVTVAMFITLEPFFTALLSAVFLGTVLSGYDALGGLLIAVGVAVFLWPMLSSSSSEEEAQEPEFLARACPPVKREGRVGGHFGVDAGETATLLSKKNSGNNATVRR